MKGLLHSPALLVAFTLLGVPAAPRASLALGPRISEFLADNHDGLRDEDGDASDWIEIQNPGISAVSLQGWSLTDDIRRVRRWHFPAVSIAPAGYLVVFASGKNRAVAGAPLHTDFHLDTEGEDLALLDPRGAVAREF